MFRYILDGIAAAGFRTVPFRRPHLDGLFDEDHFRPAAPARGRACRRRAMTAR
jgi:hypothetical protein